MQRSLRVPCGTNRRTVVLLEYKQVYKPAGLSPPLCCQERMGRDSKPGLPCGTVVFKAFVPLTGASYNIYPTLARRPSH